jgi:hypothetical protein
MPIHALGTPVVSMCRFSTCLTPFLSQRYDGEVGLVLVGFVGLGLRVESRATFGPPQKQGCLLMFHSGVTLSRSLVLIRWVGAWPRTLRLEWVRSADHQTLARSPCSNFELPSVAGMRAQLYSEAVQTKQAAALHLGRVHGHELGRPLSSSRFACHRGLVREAHGTGTQTCRLSGRLEGHPLSGR